MYFFLKKPVSILLMLSVLTYLTNGQVLCYGYDGHTAFEPISHSHCGHEHEKHHNNSGSNIDKYSLKDCVNCEDIHIDKSFEKPHSADYIVVKRAPETSSVLQDYMDIDLKLCDFYTFFSPLKIIVLLT